MIVFDGHNDTLKQTFLSGRDLFSPSTEGHIDIHRAKTGKLAGGFFAILTPAEWEAERTLGYGLTLDETSWEVRYPNAISQQFAVDFVDTIIAQFVAQVAQRNDIKIVTDYRELEACIQHDVLAAVLHLEGAEAIMPDLSNLKKYYNYGVRSIGIVWSRQNVFGFGVPFKFPSGPDTGPGLTPLGKALVRECNALGLVVDLAHITEKGFWDVAKISTAPLVVTHANVNAICPSSTNLTDDQIRAVGKSNGVIGVIFDILTY